MQKAASSYSIYCSPRNQAPSATVSPIYVSCRRPASTAWWAAVTETPDRIRISVLRSGTPIGSTPVIPGGGHVSPTPILGLNVKWKKAQNSLKKNITSEAMKKPIASINPRLTGAVWYP